MASISRASAGQQNKNRLRVHRCKIYLQQIPGKIGTDEERAVTQKPRYQIEIDGGVAQWGTLGDDGSIEAFIPAGAAATLEVLGTRYDLKVLLDIEPHDTLKGAQRRLQLLGYYDARVDDKYGARTDAALLDFQGDNGEDPDGDVGAAYDKIRDTFGE